MTPSAIITATVWGAFVGWIAYALRRDFANARRSRRERISREVEQPAGVRAVARHGCADGEWADITVHDAREVGQLEDLYSLPAREPKHPRRLA